MAYCDSCNNLTEYASNFMLNGINEATCNSLVANTGLNPNVSGAVHENCEDLKDMADCLLGALVEKLPAYDECTLKDFVAQLTPNVYNMVYALVCSTCGLWTRLESLEEIVKAILQQKYTELVSGRDFETIFYNGITTPSGTVRVSVLETQETLAVQVYGGAASNTQLQKSNVKEISIRHSSGVYEDPASWLYAINFLGDYAKYNNRSNYTEVNLTQQTTGIWNIQTTPANGRASWHTRLAPALGFVDPNTNKSWRMLATLFSYADGFNTQFSTAYPDYALNLTAGNHQLDFTLISNSN